MLTIISDNLNPSTNFFRYDNDNGTHIGSVIPGSADLGDYGANVTMDMIKPNGQTMHAIPENKLNLITESEFKDIKYLIYGF